MPGFSLPRLYAVTELLMEHHEKTVKEIVGIINSEIPGINFHKEHLYKYLREAYSRGFFEITPPPTRSLPGEVRRKFDLSHRPEGSITVFDSESFRPIEHATAHAAKIVLKLIKDVSDRKNPRKDADAGQRRPVCLGFGPGRTVLGFCQQLSRRLRNDRKPLSLKLIALTGGWLGTESQLAPTSFFNLFSGEVEAIGLFSDTLMPCEAFDRIKGQAENHPGLKEAFAAKDDIDIIVTSLGDIDDEHDLLGSLYREARLDPEELKRESGYVGSVIYRPYSADGPIDEPPDRRRTTSLFELKELAQRINADRNKYLVIIAHSCPRCTNPRRNRSVALRPLLANKDLQIWTHMIMDAATARALAE